MATFVWAVFVLLFVYVVCSSKDTSSLDPFVSAPVVVPPSAEDLRAEERREVLQPLNKLDCPESFDPDSPTNAPLWDRVNKLRLQKVRWPHCTACHLALCAALPCVPPCLECHLALCATLP